MSTELILNQEYFETMYSGDKTIEGRKNSPTWSKLKVGETLLVRNRENDNRFFFVKIVALRRYKDDTGIGSLNWFLQSEGLRRTLPGTITLDQGLDVYLKLWPYDEITEYGMLAIEVERI